MSTLRNDAVETRASNDGYLYATYSWEDGSTTYPISASEYQGKLLAIQAYNFGRSNNKNAVCANIMTTLFTNGRAGSISVIDAGEYSLALGGTYTDNSDLCENIQSSNP